MPYRWSWLGIHSRYESLKAKKSFARIVSEADHDDRFVRLQQTLRIVLDSPSLDHVAVYKRKLSVERDASAALELLTEAKAEAPGAFLEVVERPMDDQERALFLNECARIVSYMQDRNAGAEHIDSFIKKVDRLAAE